jgi:hypothetical protein
MPERMTKILWVIASFTIDAPSSKRFLASLCHRLVVGRSPYVRSVACQPSSPSSERQNHLESCGLGKNPRVTELQSSTNPQSLKRFACSVLLQDLRAQQFLRPLKTRDHQPETHLSLGQKRKFLHSTDVCDRKGQIC